MNKPYFCRKFFLIDWCHKRLKNTIDLLLFYWEHFYGLSESDENLKYLFKILAAPLQSTLITAQIENLLLIKEWPAQINNRNIKTSSDNQDTRTTNGIMYLLTTLNPTTLPPPTLSRYLLALFLQDSQRVIHTNKTRPITKIIWINQLHESHESFRLLSCFVVSPVCLQCLLFWE